MSVMKHAWCNGFLGGQINHKSKSKKTFQLEGRQKNRHCTHLPTNPKASTCPYQTKHRKCEQKMSSTDCCVVSENWRENGKGENKHTLPPRKAPVSAAMIVLMAIIVARSPTVH